MSDIFNPLVSIVIPVYNGSKYMREAINSALSQTYKNIEILVINDGSNDNGETREIALSYGDQIRYFEKENGGVATALNLGIKEMRGEYFSWLSHDDVYFPDKVEFQISFLSEQKNKEIGLYGDFIIINSDSKQIGIHKNYHEKKNTFYAVLNGLIHGCTLLIPKKFFFEISFFDSSLVTVQDYDLWFKIFRNNEIIHTARFLVKSRDHADQGSKTLECHFEEREALFEKMLISLTKEEILKLEPVLSLFYIKMSVFLIRCRLKRSSRIAYDKYLLEGEPHFYFEILYRIPSIFYLQKIIYHIIHPKIGLMRIMELRRRFLNLILLKRIIKKLFNLHHI